MFDLSFKIFSVPPIRLKCIVTIATRIDTVRAQLLRGDTAPQAAPRLIAVSKTRSVEEIRCAAAAGVCDFGENYLQDALPKIAATTDLDINWHFIGRIQSNKVRDLAQHFQWIHTVDRVKVAQGLSRYRSGEPLNLCIQLDLEASERRYGVTKSELPTLLRQIESLPGLRPRGLMLMPAPGKDEQALRAAFARAKTIFEMSRDWLSQSEYWDTLSMGMSGDFAMALEEGSNCVRIGTAIFGPRT